MIIDIMLETEQSPGSKYDKTYIIINLVLNVTQSYKLDL